MILDDLTLGQIKELTSLLNIGSTVNVLSTDIIDGKIVETGLNSMVGKKAIIRTYSAGVWFGKVLEKNSGEIILGDARRLYYWKTTNKGISLSEVSLTGLHSDSKVCEAVEKVWLQPIEIIPCTDEAIKNIEGQQNYVA